MSIFVLDNFLTDIECDEYIDKINKSSDSKDIKPFNNMADSINNRFEDPEIVDTFYQRLKKRIDSEISELEDVEPCNIVMWARYKPGGKFGLHTDTGYFYDNENQKKSCYTFLIYLNDDYKGGETVFYTDNFKEDKVITPKKGSCLIFDIDLWHKGNEVLDGQKYWIGSELVASF